MLKYISNKTGVNNDPLGQTHSQASSEHCFQLFCFARFEKWGRKDVQKTCAKTMIPTDRDFGLARVDQLRQLLQKFGVPKSMC